MTQPRGVVVDSSGDLYITDAPAHVVRKVSSGTITTFAGTGVMGYSGDGGPATSAKIRSPYGITVDSSGSVYIADSGNSAVRRIRGGVIVTIAGSGVSGFAGDGGAATSAVLGSPYDVALDAAGYLYMSDDVYNVVRSMFVGF